VVAQSGVEITPFEPRLLGPLADFYQAVWDPRATPDGLARARARQAAENLAQPGQETPTWVFVKAGQIIGHVTTLPVRLRQTGRERPAYWFVGLMVLPEHRNGPVGFLLMREAAKSLELTLSLSVQPAAVRLFRAVGFKELGVIANFVRPLRPAAIIRRMDVGALGLGGLPRVLRVGLEVRRLPGVSALGGLAVRTGLVAWSAWHRAGSRSRGLLERPMHTPGADAIDQLWGRVRDALGCTIARDAGYMGQRFGFRESGPYRAAAVYEGSALVGLAVVRAAREQGDPRLRGIRMATISDLVFDPAREDVGLRLLSAAERTARELGADAVLLSASHGSMQPLLRRRAYLRFGGNLHFLVRDGTDTLPGTTKLGDWWLLRGDADADHSF
jgi:predicted N-acetyltransferase YhbS